MSASSLTPDQPSLRANGPGQSLSGRNGVRDLVKLIKGLALVASALAAVVVGIAIGNAARKRIDRLGRGMP